MCLCLRFAHRRRHHHLLLLVSWSNISSLNIEWRWWWRCIEKTIMPLYLCLLLKCWDIHHSLLGLFFSFQRSDCSLIRFRSMPVSDIIIIDGYIDQTPAISSTPNLLYLFHSFPIHYALKIAVVIIFAFNLSLLAYIIINLNKSLIREVEPSLSLSLFTNYQQQKQTNGSR